MTKDKGYFIISKSDGSSEVIRGNTSTGEVFNGKRKLKSRNIQNRETKVDMTRSINKMKEDNQRAIDNSFFE